MKINKLNLRNIRSYDSLSVDFDDGLILVEGDNGAGKSSLLGSIFSGLYLSDVLKYMDDDVNLDSLVKKGCDEGMIHIIFSINNDKYEIKWELSVRDDGDDRQASTKSCVLTSDAIDDPIEGVRDVQNTVKNTIGMNTESFVNSVYVKQGDITRMVNANGEKRKEIIDGLLGLSKLDTYVERMDKVRLEFGSQKRRLDDLLNEKQNRIDQFDKKKTIVEEINKLNNEKQELNDKIDDIDSKIESVKEQISDLDDQISQYKDIKKELDNIKEQVKEKKVEKDEYLDKKQEAQSNVEEFNDKLDNLDSEVSDLCDKYGIERNTIDNEISALRSDISELEQDQTRIKDGQIENKESTISRLRNEIETITNEIQDLKDKKSETVNKIDKYKDRLEDNKSELDQLKDEIQNHKETINKICENLDLEYNDLDNLKDNKIPEARDNVIERVSSVYEDLGYAKAEQDIYNKLIDNDLCPICGECNDIENHNEDDLRFDIDEVKERVKAIEDQNQQLNNLSSEIECLQQKKSDKKILETKQEQIKTNLKSSRNKKQEYSENIDNKKDKIGDKNKNINDKKDKVEDLEEELSNIVERKDKLDSKVENYKDIKNKISKINNIENKISKYEDKIDKYEELRKNIQEQYTNKKQRKKKLKDKIKDSDIKDLKSNKKETEEALTKLREAKSSARDQIDNIQSKIAEKEQQKTRVEKLKEEINGLEEEKIKASKNENDAESVMNSYKSVKTELREENIGLLNKYANEVFQSVYSNKIYQKLKIDKQYNIRLITGDNVEIEPKDLSGGEKTILSLSIRAGVYKLLVERNGNTDTLPPFILDEPTTFLDDEHVSNLQDVIDKITSWNVPQVFIVSHKDNMIDNADSVYTVEKEPSSENSTVKKSG